MFGSIDSGGIIVAETDPQNTLLPLNLCSRGRDRPTRRKQMSTWGECCDMWRRRARDGVSKTGADRWAGMGLQGLAHRFFSKDW